MIFFMVRNPKAKTTKNTLSRTTKMHHFAWGIVCLLLIVSVGGLWIHAQSLDKKIGQLEKQLQLSKKPAPDTCRVSSDWKANESKILAVYDRKYIVHLPKNFSNSEYYPLLLFFPGRGGSAEASQQVLGLDSLPAIITYPYPSINKQGEYAWQGAPYSSTADDVGFISNVIDDIQAKLCIDRTKIYAAGLSNGGGFAALLSCRLSDRIAAIAVVSGAMYSPAGDCTPPSPMPLISVHGDRDAVVPYEGSLTRRLPSIDAWTKNRAMMNGCKTPTSINDGVQSIVTVWNDCKDNAVVQNIRIIGGIHAWGEIANDTLWNFLSKYSR